MGQGKNLKLLLDDRGVKASQFAKDTGLNVHTIYSFINRDSDKIDSDFLKAITSYFHIPEKTVLIYEDLRDLIGPEDEYFTDGYEPLVEWAQEELCGVIPKLNKAGIYEAIHRVSELTEVPKYQRNADNEHAKKSKERFEKEAKKYISESREELSEKIDNK